MNTANLKKKLNIEKHETIGGLDLPEGRELKEEVIENSKINYAATMVSVARRQIIGGGAPINKNRRRRRPQIVGGGAARPAHGSKSSNSMLSLSASMGVVFRGLSMREVQDQQQIIYTTYIPDDKSLPIIYSFSTRRW